MDCEGVQLTPEQVLEQVKESIKKIKNQKQRPGFDRIAQCLKTHHNISDAIALREVLDSALRKGQLLTVWTKGLQCYKDPEALKALRKFSVTSPAEARRAAKAAVREIGDPDGSRQTVVLNYVRYSFMIKTTDLQQLIAKALEHLVQKGDLVLSNERYKPVHFTTVTPKPIPGGEPSMDDFAIEADVPPPENVPVAPKVGRPKGSVKKTVKKEEDSDEYDVPAAAVKQEIEESSHIEQSSDAGREFYLFQCWCCRVFSPTQQDFIKHVGSRGHLIKTKEKIVYCSSCRFRSRQRDRLLGHLTKHACHEGSGLRPACMLTFGGLPITASAEQ